MSRRVVLLRGVNVGGAGRLPMAGFRALLEGLGLQRVATFIQSGNAVFDGGPDAATLETMIRDAIAAEFGFAPEVLVLTPEDLAEALAGHPFAGADPARVQVVFLRQAPALDEAALRALALPGEDWQMGRRWVALHTPGGIGGSKLAAALPRLLAGPGTARNLRTLAALHRLAAGEDLAQA